MTASSEPRTVGPALARPIAVRSWPVRESGWRAILPISGLAALGAVVGAASGLAVAGLVVTLLMVAVSWRYWLPVDFDLDSTGVTQRLGRRRWRMPWAAIGGYAVLPHGARLWPAGRGAFSARARSLCIPWNGQREALLAVLAEYLGPASP